MSRKERYYLAGSIATVLLALLMIGASFGFYYGVIALMNHGLVQEAVVKDKNAGRYDMWLDNTDFTPEYECHNFFNLTNWEDVVYRSQLPVVEEVGPYCYRFIKSKLDISWSDDEDKVTYNEWQRFLWEPDMSVGDQKDLITNVNPAYFGVVGGSGGELGMSIGFAGPSTEGVLMFLQTQFVRDLLATNTPAPLNATMTTLVDTIASAQNVSQQVAAAEFASAWANATECPPPALPGSCDDWRLVLISLNSTASGISPASAAQLLSDGPLGLLNTSVEATSFWAAAAWQCVEDGANSVFDVKAPTTQYIYPGPLSSPPCSAYLAQLNATFALDEAEATQLLTWWLAVFQAQAVAQPLLSKHRVDTVEDLGWVQWGQAGLSAVGDGSVAALYPDLFPAPPEYALFEAEDKPIGIDRSMSVAAAKQLLNGTYGIFGMPEVGEFADAVAEDAEACVVDKQCNATNLHEKWGVRTIPAAFDVIGYLTYMAAKYSSVNLPKIFAAGGGIVTTRTVYEWLWDAIDPLLMFALPEDPNACLICNMTSADEVRAKQLPSTFYTGKKDLSKIGVTINFEEQTYLPYYNLPPPGYPVGGVNQEGQFEPFIMNEDPNYQIKAWDPDFLRVITLEPVGDATIRGIKMRRYEVSNQTFLPDPLMYQHIQGFANVSGAYEGSPVFLSNSHMLGASSEYVNKVTGMVQDPPNDITRVFVEPTSGIVMAYAQALQFNQYTPVSPPLFTVFFPNITTDVMYPVMVAEQHAELSSEDAKEFRNSVYFAEGFAQIGFWVIVGVGLLTLVLGIGLAVRMRVVKQRRIDGGGEETDALLRDPLIQ